MLKFISPDQKIKNDESLKGMIPSLEKRLNRYKYVENEKYIGSNHSPYYRTKKLETTR
jgi:hypothetical protein